MLVHGTPDDVYATFYRDLFTCLKQAVHAIKKIKKKNPQMLLI